VCKMARGVRSTLPVKPSILKPQPSALNPQP
jgi:hypothetical protein